MNREDANLSSEVDGQSAAPQPHDRVSQFLAERTMRGHVVVAPIGLCSLHAISHLTQRLLESQPLGRILVLSAPTVFEQAEYAFTVGGGNVEAVDRSRFSEKRSAATDDESIWPTGRAFILRMDFAKREPTARSLCNVAWTFLIVINAEDLVGTREAFAQQVIAESPGIRVLLLAHSPRWESPTFGIQPWGQIRWRWSDIADSRCRCTFGPPVQD